MAQISRMLDLGRIFGGMKVLEPGCGIGRLTRILAHHVGPRERALAMDISARMVRDCHRNMGLGGDVKALCNVVKDYPQPRQAFDAVSCHQMFPHFDDRSRVSRLFANTSAPSGVLIVFHLISSALINEVHRRSAEAVSNYWMPPQVHMTSMFYEAGFQIDPLEENENGYPLMSHVRQ